MDDYISSERRVRPQKADNEFSASTVTGCLRQSTKLKLGLAEPGTKLLRIFMVGTLVHRLLQGKASIGNLPRPVQFERDVELAIGEGDEMVKFSGHLDAYDGEWVYDFKTSSRKAAYLEKQPIPKAYLYQISIYAEAMTRDDVTPRAAIVYISKADLSIVQKEVDLVPIDEIAAFCRQVMEAVKEYRLRGNLPKHDDCLGCYYEKRFKRKD